MTTPEDFVKIAKTWVGVPWKPSGSHRNGVNCIGLFIGIARELEMEELVESVVVHAGFATPPFSGSMLKKMREHLQGVALTEITVGDILVFKVDNEPQHVAVITEPGIILHADHQAKKVIEHKLPSSWRPVAAFRLKEPEIDDVDK